MHMIYEWSWRLANQVRVAIGRKPQPRRCCKRPENLSDPTRMRPDLLVRLCRVCGSRHFELTVDPIKIAVRQSSVGG